MLTSLGFCMQISALVIPLPARFSNDFLLTAYLKQTNIVTAVILSIVSQ